MHLNVKNLEQYKKFVFSIEQIVDKTHLYLGKHHNKYSRNKDANALKSKPSSLLSHIIK